VVGGREVLCRHGPACVSRAVINAWGHHILRDSEIPGHQTSAFVRQIGRRPQLNRIPATSEISPSSTSALRIQHIYSGAVRNFTRFSSSSPTLSFRRSPETKYASERASLRRQPFPSVQFISELPPYPFDSRQQTLVDPRSTRQLPPEVRFESLLGERTQPSTPFRNSRISGIGYTIVRPRNPSRWPMKDITPRLPCLVGPHRQCLTATGIDYRPCSRF
jgi:hypothetical protein